MGPGWRVEINRQHVGLWGALLAGWLAFVAFGLVIGWHLGPRLDEVLIILVLPLWLVVIPYALLCLLIAVARLLWPTIGRHWPPWLTARKRIGRRPRP